MGSSFISVGQQRFPNNVLLCSFHSTNVPTGPDIAVVSDQVVGKVDVFLDDRKRRVDIDSASGPFDDLRNYAHEGCGSTSGSLSSLQSGTDDKPHEFSFLTTSGPRFDKLVNI
ncbi:AGAP009714-PA [Anopheles gambiae str. PEST]|uniref:AGAP009714-PA n=1 Tax=Anopheles gambiae TaxID=7165 RepID=Q7Q1N2_ANOGA|nr:AGAP009714-PA [Anopheles gambiae str. PEST]